MKKVLSVAMASAMVLGMGANAFAISYSTGSNEKADWPKNFQFDGELFVTNKDGDIITEATTALNDNETVNFEPGDVIWMPLYADNQLSYDADWDEGTEDKEEITSIKLDYNDATNFVVETQTLKLWANGDGKWYKVDTAGTSYDPSVYAYSDAELAAFRSQGFNVPAKSSSTATGAVIPFTGKSYVREYLGSEYKQDNETIQFNNETRKVAKNSAKYYVNGKQYKTKADFNAALWASDYTPEEAYVTVNLVKEKGNDEWVGKPSVDAENGTRAYGHYTGNIDKNWSINLIEKSTGVAELIEKAELYKATATDYASYSKYTDQIMPNAVYLKITLEDEWKTTTSETLKYYVYVAENKSNKNKTNEVWVSGKYENTDVREVSFDWTNDASKPGLWKVKEGNGIAVFDFADKAFFSVKMYEGETMYLDLKTAYDKAIAGEMDAEADSFYKFDNTNANFARTGELVIVSNDSSLVPYQIDEDGNFVAVDAEYVENYAVAHTNQKVNGFVFNTKQLGNYVLSTEELGEEEEVVEEPTTEEPVVEEPTVEEPVVEETNKPNPNTGAEDFVGLAVSLAVVSVAAAGALALKK
ncbi:MAG: hypothetical protein MR880_09420 [Negativibacillus massiliensis]|nr:hypothetical protein [Negativibacillus massiliensis]